MLFSSPDPGGRPWPPASGNYSADDILRFQQTFGPVARRHRHYRRIAFAGFIIGFLLLLISICANGISLFLFDKGLFEKHARWPLNIILWACFITATGAMLRCLKCPGCGAFLTKGIARHCPECGSERLDTDWLARPCCKDCGKTIGSYRNRGRSYRVRYCSSCGLLVDNEGL